MFTAHNVIVCDVKAPRWKESTFFWLGSNKLSVILSLSLSTSKSDHVADYDFNHRSKQMASPLKMIIIFAFYRLTLTSSQNSKVLTCTVTVCCP